MYDSHRTGHRVRLTVDLREPTPTAALEAAVSGLPVTWEQGEGLRHFAEFQRRDVAGAEVIKRLVNACPVSDLRLAEPDIEEIVREIYRNGPGSAS